MPFVADWHRAIGGRNPAGMLIEPYVSELAVEMAAAMEQGLARLNAATADTSTEPNAPPRLEPVL